MKEIKQQGAQGDVLFRRVKALPAEAARQTTLVVAHSETGHHHIATAEIPNAAVLFTLPNDPLRAFLKLERGNHIDIVHQRPWDTHETMRLLVDSPDDVWEIRRQREHTPEGWRQVQD